MNTKYHLLAIVLLNCGVHCSISPYINEPQTTSFYQCLKTSGYTWATMFVPSDS